MTPWSEALNSIKSNFYCGLVAPTKVGVFFGLYYNFGGKMIEYVDIVADLSWGDTGKGKITSALDRDWETNPQ